MGFTPFYHSNKDIMFKNIITKKPPFFSGMDKNAKSIISQLLIKDPTKRLGRTGGEGANAIKNSAFFSDINWDLLQRKFLKPPSKPAIREKDTRYIPKSVKKIRAEDTIPPEETYVHL